MPKQRWSIPRQLAASFFGVLTAGICVAIFEPLGTEGMVVVILAAFAGGIGALNFWDWFMQKWRDRRLS